MLHIFVIIDSFVLFLSKREPSKKAFIKEKKSKRITDSIPITFCVPISGFRAVRLRVGVKVTNSMPITDQYIQLYWPHSPQNCVFGQFFILCRFFREDGGAARALDHPGGGGAL